jgi:hypothetical protein
MEGGRYIKLKTKTLLNLLVEIDNSLHAILSLSPSSSGRGRGRRRRRGQTRPLGNLAFLSIRTEANKALFPLVHSPQDKTDIQCQREHEEVPH